MGAKSQEDGHLGHLGHPPSDVEKKASLVFMAPRGAWFDQTPGVPEEPVKIFRLNFILLGLAGIWPPDGMPVYGLVVYVVLSLLTHAFFFTSNISFTLGMFLTSENLNAALGACSDVLVLYLTTYKIIVMLKNRKLIRQLVHALRFEFDVEHVSSEVRAECRRTDEQCDRRASTLTGLYYLCLLSVDATYFYMFMLAELKDEPRMPQWYPLDMRHINTFTWTVHCLVVLSAALVSGIHTTVFDTMLLSFSFLLGGKIDNLGRLLATLEEDDGGSRPGRDPERLRRLHACVRMHQRIIRFVDELESALSSLSLAQLMESLATVCLQAYRLTFAPPTLDEAFPMFVFFVWLLIQLWILCWSGENISLKSTSLAGRASRCRWFGEPRDFTIAMRMIMVRAQRPLCLTALRMVKLNCRVYLVIIKNSYSLYTCMLRMTNAKT